MCVRVCVCVRARAEPTHVEFWTSIYSRVSMTGYLRAEDSRVIRHVNLLRKENGNTIYVQLHTLRRLHPHYYF